MNIHGKYSDSKKCVERHNENNPSHLLEGLKAFGSILKWISLIFVPRHVDSDAHTLRENCEDGFIYN